MTSVPTGPCPVCAGTTRVPYRGDPKYAHVIYSYDAATNTVNCGNCGGQYMSLKPLGVVRLRADGTPCTHEYVSTKLRECYHRYDCKHCGDSHRIDSGD